MNGIYITPDTWDGIEVSDVYYKILLKEKIEQVKMDMYRDRYKAYDQPSYVLFLCPKLTGNKPKERKRE